MIKRLQRLFTGHKGNTVGIDIGTESVKLAEVMNKGEHPVLVSTGILPMPTGLIDDGHIVDGEALSGLLRQLLSTSGVSSRDVVLAIGGRTIFAREVLLPVMSEEELREAIKWDMEKYVPYEPESFYYDFAIVGKTRTELEMKVLLVAAPHDVVNPMVSIIKSIGLRPVAVDIEPLALYRTLEEATNSMVIDLGGQISQITVFQQGSPAVTRTIGVGGRRFTEVIMRNLELDYQEAENLKQRQKGLLHRVGWPDEPSALHRQLDLVVGELVREVRRTVEYYQIQNRDAVIDKIFLTGGASKLDNLAQHIAAQLNMPVLLHQPLRTLSSVPALDQDYLNRLFPQLATAIGLALRGGSR